MHVPPGDCVLQVSATSDEKLNQPLLQFHEESTPEMQLLAVNFDPALVRLLKETKYFILLGVEVSARMIGVHARGCGREASPAYAALCQHPRLPFLPLQVPESAQAIYQHTDRFRQQIGSLDLVVSLYNKLQRTTLPVEWPLVASKLEAVGEFRSLLPLEVLHACVCTLLTAGVPAAVCRGRPASWPGWPGLA